MISVQSITITFGIRLLVVCVVECVGSPMGDFGGERRDAKGRDVGIVRMVEKEILMYVKALCRGCPADAISLKLHEFGVGLWHTSEGPI